MVQREDLVAAASVGILQFRQIDPLLIFLLQQDVKSHREAMLAEARPTRRGYPFLSFLIGMTVVIAATLSAVFFTTQAVQSLGMGALIALTMAYALCALGLALWFKKRGLGVTIRVLSALMMVMAPVAVFALQHVVR
jgi:hypothetical protein